MGYGSGAFCKGMSHRHMRAVSRQSSPGDAGPARNAPAPVPGLTRTSQNGIGATQVRLPDPVITSLDHGGGDDRCESSFAFHNH